MKSLLKSLAVSAFALAAAPALAQEAPQSGGTLRVAIESWPLYTLLPNNNAWTPFFVNQYESLVAADDASNYHPWLAQSWTVSEDGRVYTFKLRQDVLFQDGDRFDAHAAKLSLDATIDGGVTHVPHRNSWAEKVEAITALDDFTLEIRLTGPDQIFLNQLSSLAAAILSPKSLAHPEVKAGGLNVKGTGPFELVDVIPGQRLTYKRFDAYNWAPPTALHQGPAHLDEIVLNVVNDPTVRTGLLTSDQVDLITVVNPEDIALIEGDPKLTFAAHSGNVVPWAWFFNDKGFGTSDIRVRDAIREALDLDVLVPAIFQDTAYRAWSNLIPGSKYYNARFEGSYGGDVAKANRLLDEAGWTGRNAQGVRTNDKGEALVLTLLNRGFSGNEGLFAEAVQQVLGQTVGIRLEIDTVESAQGFAKRKENKYSIFHVSVAGYDPGYSINLLWKNGGTINFSQTEDEKLNALVVAQRAALNDAERTALLDELVDYVLIEKKWLFPISVERHNSAANARVQNLDSSFAVLRKYPGPYAYDLWLKK